ncbi:MAG: hypothetical protein V4542_10190 [Pseudomonadota bacterium]
MTFFSGFPGFTAKLVRLWLALLMLFASASTAFAQTCASPGWSGPVTIPAGSNFINAYHAGASSPLVNATAITVASGTGQRTSARQLLAGDLILIMQMQDSSGGTAGQHEYAQIASISGVNITLTKGLTYAYNQSMTTGSVRNWQVIWVPQYSALTVTGSVSPDTWTIATGTGQATGGVVALDVAGSLALNGTVTASGMGFRGAFGLSGTATVTATVTTANINFDPTSVATVNGGQKGEGTLGTPPRVFAGVLAALNYTALLGQGYALGAGGQASIGNAGGGANDGYPSGANGTSTNSLNSGGGGGGNGGAGGQGGNSWNSNGLIAVLNSNQTVTQTGNIAGGKGGNVQALDATRLTMGGGGGAGAANNASANVLTTFPPTNTSTVANGASGAITSSGGLGGGVVLIRAGSVTGAGVIDVSGYRSYNKSLSTDTDSAGGGGAGGAIFFVAGSGTGTGITLRANGGAGGSSSYFNHGPGGGGGGGYILTNLTAAALSATGGANGTDGCCGGMAGNGSPKAWNSAPGSAGVTSTAGGTPSGLGGGGGSCLPVIAVTKTTSTPSITTATGATATYSINLSNTGGGAANVLILDRTLPPGWLYASTPATTYSYSPSPGAGGLTAGAAGAETNSASMPVNLPVDTLVFTNSITAVNLRPAATAPGSATTTAVNTPTFGSFYLPSAGSLTVTFAVTIPNTATVGTYHNPAGVVFLDPTRTSTAVRMVSPATAVNANRAGAAYSSNTTYASGATVNVGGSNYSGLAAGPTTDDVTLLPDLSVTKSMNTPTFTIGTGSLSYVIVGRNNGRPIADQVYANTQATAQSATTIMSTPLSITDTLPVGMTLTSVANTPTAWTCAVNGTSTTFTCTAGAAVYPLPAATNLVTVTATVAVSSLACPGPRINTATFTTSPLGDAVPGNNTGTVTTPINCSTNMTVTKTDGRTTVTAGSTTSYTVTFANLGPAAGDGALLTDTPSAGLSCSVASCAPGGTGVCPTAGLWPDLLGGGLTLPSFASGSTVTFIVNCNVTATGQ